MRRVTSRRRSGQIAAVPSGPQTGVPAAFAPYIPAALSEVNVPAYVIDRHGTICWLNDAGRSVCGDVIGRPFTEVVAVDKERARRIFESNIAGFPNPDRSIEVQDAHGRKTRVEISSTRLGSGHHVVGMFGLAVPKSKPPSRVATQSPLTVRQHEILEHLALGESTAMIAEELFLSRETVRNHVRQILQRLGTNSRLSAVAEARRQGYI